MMIRMFHISCDSPKHRASYPDLADEWYASMAKQQAKDAGWHLASGDRAICDLCWNDGIRFKDIVDMYIPAVVK